ncbi:MAG: hypothetical protein LBV29_07335 [Azoarcus sp.]|nr:hypothetical protein [Azoarcus sp.]
MAREYQHENINVAPRATMRVSIEFIHLMNRQARWIVGIVVALLALLAWMHDFVMPQGERTVYTVDCAGGTWNGVHCSGRLVAGERYRFRALKARNEVIFWKLASPEPSGKLSGCEVRDGHNWKCGPGPDAARSIGLKMSSGRLRHDTEEHTRAFRATTKWKWWLLHFGVGGFKRADY